MTREDLNQKISVAISQSASGNEKLKTIMSVVDAYLSESNCDKPAIASVCSWCGEQILAEQLTSKCCDSETMHFGCACEADEAEIGDYSSS